MMDVWGLNSIYIYQALLKDPLAVYGVGGTAPTSISLLYIQKPCLQQSMCLKKAGWHI